MPSNWSLLITQIKYIITSSLFFLLSVTSFCVRVGKQMAARQVLNSLVHDVDVKDEQRNKETTIKRDGVSLDWTISKTCERLKSYFALSHNIRVVFLPTVEVFNFQNVHPIALLSIIEGNVVRLLDQVVATTSSTESKLTWRELCRQKVISFFETVSIKYPHLDAKLFSGEDTEHTLTTSEIKIQQGKDKDNHLIVIQFPLSISDTTVYDALRSTNCLADFNLLSEEIVGEVTPNTKYVIDSKTQIPPFDPYIWQEFWRRRRLITLNSQRFQNTLWNQFSLERTKEFKSASETRDDPVSIFARKVQLNPKHIILGDLFKAIDAMRSLVAAPGIVQGEIGKYFVRNCRIAARRVNDPSKPSIWSVIQACAVTLRLASVENEPAIRTEMLAIDQNNPARIQENEDVKELQAHVAMCCNFLLILLEMVELNSWKWREQQEIAKMFISVIFERRAMRTAHPNNNSIDVGPKLSALSGNGEAFVVYNPESLTSIATTDEQFETQTMLNQMTRLTRDSLGQQRIYRAMSAFTSIALSARVYYWLGMIITDMLIANSQAERTRFRLLPNSDDPMQKLKWILLGARIALPGLTNYFPLSVRAMDAVLLGVSTLPYIGGHKFLSLLTGEQTKVSQLETGLFLGIDFGRFFRTNAEPDGNDDNERDHIQPLPALAAILQIRENELTPERKNELEYQSFFSALAQQLHDSNWQPHATKMSELLKRLSQEQKRAATTTVREWTAVFKRYISDASFSVSVWDNNVSDFDGKSENHLGLFRILNEGGGPDTFRPALDDVQLITQHFASSRLMAIEGHVTDYVVLQPQFKPEDRIGTVDEHDALGATTETKTRDLSLLSALLVSTLNFPKDKFLPPARPTNHATWYPKSFSNSLRNINYTMTFAKFLAARRLGKIRMDNKLWFSQEEIQTAVQGIPNVVYFGLFNATSYGTVALFIEHTSEARKETTAEFLHKQLNKFQKLDTLPYSRLPAFILPGFSKVIKSTLAYLQSRYYRQSAMSIVAHQDPSSFYRDAIKLAGVSSIVVVSLSSTYAIRNYLPATLGADFFTDTAKYARGKLFEKIGTGVAHQYVLASFNDLIKTVTPQVITNQLISLGYLAGNTTQYLAPVSEFIEQSLPSELPSVNLPVVDTLRNVRQALNDTLSPFSDDFSIPGLCDRIINWISGLVSSFYTIVGSGLGTTYNYAYAGVLRSESVNPISLYSPAFDTALLGGALALFAGSIWWGTEIGETIMRYVTKLRRLGGTTFTHLATAVLLTMLFIRTQDVALDFKAIVASQPISEYNTVAQLSALIELAINMILIFNSWRSAIKRLM